LASSDLKERLEILISLPDRQKLDKEVEDKTQEAMRRDQKEYYLRKKAKVIRDELRGSGDIDSDEILEYLKKLKKEPYPEYVKEVVDKEIEDYKRSSGHNSEANVVRLQYIE
jgi:ATP-dependent Lon protease